MNNYKLATIAGAVVLTAFANVAVAQEHIPLVTDYVKANVIPWLADPVIIKAVNEQDAANANLSQADIDTLDKQWRAEVDAGDKPLIGKVMGNDLSKFLADKREASGGLITEAFVTDNKGLNVGQSDVTSDYWQGDEAKWKKSFGAGADAIFVDDVEKDESTQQLQSQVSITISDPATKQPIGAITLGIAVDGL